MIKYSVHFTSANGDVQNAGILLLKDNLASFRYESTFVKDGISLDPSELPLQQGVFNSDKGLFSVFEDALPDGWGRSLIVRKYGNSFGHPNKMLSKVSLGKSIGALSFSLTGERLPTSSKSPPISGLPEFIKSIENEESGSIIDAAYSAGGAQPKFVLDDGGVGVIVKFPRKNDKFDLPGLEAACMTVAQDIGLHVPRFAVGIAGDRRFYKVERFDLLPNGGRKHCISMKTILSVEGYYRKSYLDMAYALKKYSCEPKEDCGLLFKQCVLNALIGNTDDHLKNFMMVNDGSGYRLSPCFDILPNISGSLDHVLTFCTDSISPRLSELVSLGSSMGIKEPREVIKGVSEAAEAWGDIAIGYGVPDDQVAYFSKKIERCLGKISQNKRPDEGLIMEFQ